MREQGLQGKAPVLTERLSPRGRQDRVDHQGHIQGRKFPGQDLHHIGPAHHAHLDGTGGDLFQQGRKLAGHHFRRHPPPPVHATPALGGQGCDHREPVDTVGLKAAQVQGETGSARRI